MKKNWSPQPFPLSLVVYSVDCQQCTKIPAEHKDGFHKPSSILKCSETMCPCVAPHPACSHEVTVATDRCLNSKDRFHNQMQRQLRFIGGRSLRSPPVKPVSISTCIKDWATCTSARCSKSVEIWLMPTKAETRFAFVGTRSRPI